MTFGRRKFVRKKKSKLETFLQDLIDMKTEAGQLGLFITMHALDQVLHRVGFELADKIERKEIKAPKWAKGRKK